MPRGRPGEDRGQLGHLFSTTHQREKVLAPALAVGSGGRGRGPQGQHVVHHGGVVPEYAGLQPLEPGTRLESLLGQRAAKALVMVQSLGLASTRVQGSHQQSPGRLAQRCTRGQYLRRADCARDVTLPQQDRRQQFPRLLQQGVEPASRADREILIGDVLERLPPPQAEGFDERVMSLGQQALADRGPSAVDGIPEDRGVARFTAHLEGVPGGPRRQGSTRAPCAWGPAPTGDG